MKRRNFLSLLPFALIPLGGPSLAEPKPKTLPVGLPHHFCQKCLWMMDVSGSQNKPRKTTACRNPHCERYGIEVEVLWLESKVAPHD